MSLQKLFLFLLIAIMQGQAVYSRTSRFQPGKSEAELAFEVRLGAACQSTVSQPPFDIENNNNGDLTNVANYAGSFTKLLEHDPVTGVLTPFGQEQMEKFLHAMTTGKQADYNAIQRTPGIQRVFVNPEAGLAWCLEGIDTSLAPMPVAPSVTSPVAAAEILEIYLQAICRDVDYNDYGTGLNTDADGQGGSLTLKACAVLTALLPNYNGPTQNGVVTPQVLFRGNSAGDLVGPYISQFLYLPTSLLIPAGCAGFVAGLIGVPNLPQHIIHQQQLYPIPGQREFGVSWNDFIAIQNGFIPNKYVFSDYDPVNLRHLINGRDLGGYVHGDAPYQPSYIACMILAGNGFPLSPVFPYANGSIKNESAGFTMGPPDAFFLLAGATTEAFKAAWAEKWRAQWRLRPEAMAGLVHYAKVTGTNPYNLDPSIFVPHAGIDVLAWVQQNNIKQAAFPANNLTIQEAATYLLSQMYPEASPAHTAYPSGHATGCGAGVTVLKAIFNDQAKIKNFITPVKPDPANPAHLIPLVGEGENEMTVASELDKLASNLALGRDFAGVHWRTDGEQGILLGEEMAIHYLQDHARIYNEQGFTGFELTKRNGQRIRITATTVEVIS